MKENYLCGPDGLSRLLLAFGFLLRSEREE